MPYMLRKRILSKNDLDDNATWKEDLPDSGSITAFELRINCDRKGDRADLSATHPLIEMVKRVELIAESTRKVVSLSGRQADFMSYLDFKRVVPRRHREQAGTDNHISIFLMGGRSLYDREYGFDMAKLQNAFLNYTYNLHETENEYFLENDHDITVYQWAWKGPEAPVFKGYFRTRQVLDYTTSGEDDIKVVRITPGLPLRRIVVQKTTFDTSITGTWKEIELEVNNGEYSPVVITQLHTWLEQQVLEYGLQGIQTGKVFVPIADNRVVAPADFETYQGVQVSGHGYTEPFDAQVYSDITLPLRIDGGQIADVNYLARGLGYQGCLLIGFDHFDDGYDLLDTAGMSALKLLLTEKAAAKTGTVTLQEVVLY